MRCLQARTSGKARVFQMIFLLRYLVEISALKGIQASGHQKGADV